MRRPACKRMQVQEWCQNRGRALLSLPNVGLSLCLEECPIAAARVLLRMPRGRRCTVCIMGVLRRRLRSQLGNIQDAITHVTVPVVQAADWQGRLGSFLQRSRGVTCQPPGSYLTRRLLVAIMAACAWVACMPRIHEPSGACGLSVGHWWLLVMGRACR